MNLLITKKKSELTTPESINFTELVRNSNTTLSLNCQSDMIDLLNTEFTEKQQQWYIANLYLYLNYDSSIDYPINLENVYKMIGFANKGNAKRTLENNFTKEEDYKIIVLPREKKQNVGRNEEDIMLNIDAFKSLCMLAKTDKGKEIRKYYVKLESINNKIIKKQIKEQTKLLLQDKDKLHQIEMQVKIENTLKNSFNKKHLVYLIKIINNANDEIIYKFGYTDDISTRLRTHKNQIGDDIELIYCIESKDNKMLEKLLIDYLEQYKFRIKRIINDKQQTELLKVNDIEIVKNKLIELNRYIQNDQLLIIELKNDVINLKNEIIEVKNQNLELKQQLLKDDTQIIDNLKHKIEMLENTILDYKLDNKFQDVPFVKNEDVIEDKIFKKRQVDKINPTTLNIIETYESINAIIIKNPNYSYNQIYRNIKSNNVSQASLLSGSYFVLTF